jgi:hypothetical protein
VAPAGGVGLGKEMSAENHTLQNDANPFNLLLSYVLPIFLGFRPSFLPRRSASSLMKKIFPARSASIQ